MKLDMRMDDKPIRIKKGTNWKTLFLTLTFIAVVILAMTSKYWSEDEREIIFYNVDNEITFRNMKVNVTDYNVDTDKGIGEITLMVNQTLLEDKLTYSMSYDGTYAYQETAYKVIMGSILPNATDDGYVQEVMIQYSLPDDYWYISLIVSQEDFKTEEIQIDYRKQKEKVLTSKGIDYLKQFDDINIKILQQEKAVKELEEIVNGYTASIEELQKKIETEETKLKIITDKKLMEEKQKVIDNDKKAMHDADINLSENKKKLEDAKNELGNLQKQKEEQR